MSRREDGTWYSERHSAKERNIDIFHLDEEELFIMEKHIGSKDI